MDAKLEKPERRFVIWRWVTLIITVVWPLAYAVLAPEAAGRAGYYLGEGIAYGFMVGLAGCIFVASGRDRSRWVQFVVICINLFVIYKLLADRISAQKLASAATSVSEAVDYANGKGGSLSLPAQATGNEAGAQTPEHLLRLIGADVASAAPALRANRDEMAKLSLGTVLSPDTLCNTSKRTQARSVLNTYKQLTLRQIELAMGVQQAVRKRVYSYHGTDRDDLIRGYESSEGGSVARINDLKEVELSIVASAASVLALADEKEASMQCKGRLVYWPDEQSLARYNESMAAIRTGAVREAEINSEIESRRVTLQSMVHGQLPR